MEILDSSVAVAPTDHADERTRDRVVAAIVESGPLTAAQIGRRLEISSAGVRRHLDRLVVDGMLVERVPRSVGQRGRGRPARVYALTEAGRGSLPHGYEDLATTALRYLLETGGPQAVRDFAGRRADLLATALSADPPGSQAHGQRPASPAQLAALLTAAGYATSVDITAAGVQVCQHHCPVAQVAARFPELCQAETDVFARVLGTHVQRLATIAHGDGVCTTHIPAAHVPAGQSARSNGMPSTKHRLPPVDPANEGAPV